MSLIIYVSTIVLQTAEKNNVGWISDVNIWFQCSGRFINRNLNRFSERLDKGTTLIVLRRRWNCRFCYVFPHTFKYQFSKSMVYDICFALVNLLSRSRATYILRARYCEDMKLPSKHGCRCTRYTRRLLDICNLTLAFSLVFRQGEQRHICFSAWAGKAAKF